MSIGQVGASSVLKTLRWSAWLLFVVWAAFWLFFSIASAMSEIPELGPMGAITHLIMPALILGALYVAWKWELAGGILLIALVALFVAGFGWRGWMLALILDLPPLLAGLLMVASSRLALATRQTTAAA